MGGVNAQVGIGTTSPSNDLDVEGSGAAATAIDINNTSTGDPKINFQLSGSTTFSMGIDDTDSKFKIGTSALETNTRFTIDASGNCGIGTSSPATRLNVAGAYTADNEIINMIGMELTNSGYHDWAIGPTVRSGVGFFEIRGAADGLGSLSTLFTIDGNTGNFGIGTVTPSQKLHVVGNICATGTIATCSDLRYKKDIFKIDNALSLISKFNGYTYNFKVKEFPDHKFDSTAQVGFIAQELQEVLPQVVQKNESGYLSVDYAKVTPLLLMAIKEQQAEIAIQKSEIETLKAQASNSTQKLSDLENKMNAMLLLLNNKQELTVKQ